MIENFKLDIVTKFCEKINTGSILNFSLKISQHFRMHFSKNIDNSNA